MTLKDLATGTSGPRWVHTVAYLVLLAGLALPVYQQADDVFEFTNNALAESRRHFDERPLEVSLDVLGIGAVTLQYFASDRCVRVFRADMNTAKWVTYDDFQASRGSLDLVPTLLAAPLCIAAEAHKDVPTTTFGDRRDEVVQVYQHYEDGCHGWVWCHVSGQWCETHKDGTLLMHWDGCVH